MAVPSTDPPLRLAPEGWPIVLTFVAVSAAVILGAWWLAPAAGMVAACLCGALCLWCVWFFRDPPRVTPATPGAVVSPADGVVCQVMKAAPPPELGVDEATASSMVRVAVFMNVFNVHVNRAPIGGTVEKLHYRPGAFFNASFDKASEQNERMSMLVRTPAGLPIACVQIAGLVARRIVCRVAEGARLALGERYGLIRFGSRVDVYLPAGVAPEVKVGDRCVAGQTVLAVIPASAPAPPPATPVAAGGAR